MIKISFHERHSAAMRIWHWIDFLLILALLITILILDTFLSHAHNERVTQQFFPGKIDSATALQFSKALRKMLWNWHKYLGIALVFSFVFRILIECSKTSGSNLKAKLQTGIQTYKLSPRDVTIKHYLGVKISYVLFYMILFLTIASGLWLYFSDFVVALQPAAGTVKSFHGALMYFTLTFMLLHIGGLILTEIKGDKGIISEMVNGGDNI